MRQHRNNKLSVLNRIANQLVNDENFAITIMNAENGRVLFGLKNRTAAELISQFGSIEKTFETLATSGTTNIQIRTKERKNNIWKDTTEPSYFFNLSPKNSEQEPEPEPVLMPQRALQAPSQTYEAQPIQQTHNTGLHGSTMLGIPEFVDLKVAASKNAELQQKCADLKEKNKKLEKENEQLREEKLERKYSNEERKAKQEGQATMLQTLTPILQPAIEKLMGVLAPSPAVAPLALGQPNFESQAKNDFFAILQDMDEATAQYLIAVYNGLENENFVNKLTELIQTNNANTH